MAKIKERERAQAMRRNGASITRIAQEVGVSKSTVSYWCRDIQLTKDQLDRLTQASKHAGRKSLLKTAELKRQRRLKDTSEARQLGANDVGGIAHRDLHMLGLALYWGEGYKTGNEECGFTNSSTDIIRVYICWLKTIYGVNEDALILRVSINKEHKNREQAVLAYWSKVTGVPLSQFTSTSFIKSTSKKVYANKDRYYGTLRIKVRRGSMLRRRILGSLGHISKNYPR